MQYLSRIATHSYPIHLRGAQTGGLGSPGGLKDQSSNIYYVSYVCISIWENSFNFIQPYKVWPMVNIWTHRVVMWVTADIQSAGTGRSLTNNRDTVKYHWDKYHCYVIGWLCRCEVVQCSNAPQVLRHFWGTLHAHNKKMDLHRDSVTSPECDYEHKSFWFVIVSMVTAHHVTADAPHKHKHVDRWIL